MTDQTSQENEYKFEKYIGKRIHHYHQRTKPVLSIDRNRTLRFNATAIKEFGIDKYDFVELYYDRAECIVGIHLTNDGDVVSRMVLRRDGDSRQLSVGPFLHWIGYTPHTLRHFELHLDEETGFLLCTIKTGGAA